MTPCRKLKLGEASDNKLTQEMEIQATRGTILSWTKLPLICMAGMACISPKPCQNISSQESQDTHDPSTLDSKN